MRQRREAKQSRHARQSTEAEPTSTVAKRARAACALAGTLAAFGVLLPVTAAQAFNSGECEEFFLGHVVCKGATGPTGAKGATGATGAKGTVGVTGATGAAGA